MENTIRWQDVATPALYAKTVSAGKWKLYPHISLIDRALTDALSGRGPNGILVSMPPRHGKSLFCARYLPAWYLCMNPDKRVIIAAHTQEFAAEHGRAVREIVNETGPMFGITMAGHSHAAHRFDIQGRAGGLFAAGANGSVVGRGAGLLIIDDPVSGTLDAHSETMREKVWRFIYSDCMSRLDKSPIVLIIHTRWHEDDPIGRIVADPKGCILDGWKEIRLPALAEDGDELGRAEGDPLCTDLIPYERLLGFKRGDPRDWLALYQQRPGRNDNFEWPSNYFDDIWADRWPDRFERCVVALDPSEGKFAKSGDYSALIFAGISGGKIWIDSSIERRPYDKIVQDGYSIAHRYRPAIDQFYIESNSNQSLFRPLFDAYGRDHHRGLLPIRLEKSTGDKKHRIRLWVGQYLGSDNTPRKVIKLKPGPDNELLLKQLKNFPHGEHEDGPDALAMAIQSLVNTTPDYHIPEERVYA